MKKLYSTLATIGMASSLLAQAPFPVLDVNMYDSTKYPAEPDEVMIPSSPMKYDVVFTGGVDMVHNKNGASAVAKEWHDFTGYVAIDGRSDSGYVIVNHERIQADATNGDGGGMTVFTVSWDASAKKWNVVTPANGRTYRNVDFSGVGNTGANCGGIQSSWGRVFTAEEWGSAFNPAYAEDQNGNDSLVATGNEVIYRAGAGITDTSDWTVTTFNGSTVNQAIPKHMNFQYIVEVDVATATAVRKNYNMGRYDHEGGWIAGDEKSVYLSDDASSGSVLFKFVADQARDFSKGKLYAYKQSSDGNGGSWLTIPMNLDSCMHARDVALRMGATIFMRLEWVDGQGDYVYITETGRGGGFNIKGAMDKGGIAAKHLQDIADWDASAGTATDVYGRVLRLNTTNNKVEVMLEGGGPLDGGGTPTGNHLSSPDGLALTVIEGKTWLVINEDMNPRYMPANPAQFGRGKMNEIYFLDITGDAGGKTYNVTDLHRFLIGPAGCETTGGRFTPDGMTYFVNIQHPSSGNKAPFDHSVTIAVTGFKDFLTTGMEPQFEDKTELQVWPNPVSQYVYLNKVTDIRIINLSTGAVVSVARNTDQVDVSGLASGTYALQTIEGEVKRLVVQ